MKFLLSLLLLGLVTSVNAQILNAESLRKVADTSGWSGAASIDFALKRNVNDFISIGSDIHVEHETPKHLILLKNDFRFQKVENDKFTNAGILHLRYNYKTHRKMSWEVFGQAQYNKVSLVDFRGLFGSGPRLKLSNSEKYRFYLGILIMFEHEELADGITPIQRDFRGSTYFSFSLYPTEHITVVSTTYYQPLISSFSDYRISSQSSAIVGLYKNFALKMTYTFTYDEFPAVGIANSQYSFTSGITYIFD